MYKTYFDLLDSWPDIQWFLPKHERTRVNWIMEQCRIGLGDADLIDEANQIINKYDGFITIYENGKDFNIAYNKARRNAKEVEYLLRGRKIILDSLNQQ